MPAVQKQFEEFHSIIQLEDDDEKAKLREKRDTLLKNLREKLDGNIPRFENFNQGSYSMHSGIRPPDGNYDIDVGLVFDCKRDRFPDPVALKRKVRDALDTHGRSVNIRRPCVTVNYVRGEAIDYHVDLAIYVKRDDGLLELAKGKENSEAGNRCWDVADPQGLTKIICEAFQDGTELAQYRRCIRYLKHWRHFQFPNGGGPLSIALTVAAKAWFSPHMDVSGKPIDLLAMLEWVSEVLRNFRLSSTAEGLIERLQVMLPVAPHSDLMAGMTNAQMAALKLKLESLRNALATAYDEALPEDACKLLNKVFGEDFKVPPKSGTAKAVVAPVISTGSSA